MKEYHFRERRTKHEGAHGLALPLNKHAVRLYTSLLQFLLVYEH